MVFVRLQDAREERVHLLIVFGHRDHGRHPSRRIPAAAGDDLLVEGTFSGTGVHADRRQRTIRKHIRIAAQHRSHVVTSTRHGGVFWLSRLLDRSAGLIPINRHFVSFLLE